MSSLALSVMRERVKDWTGYDDPFVTNAEIDALINAVLQELQVKICSIDESRLLDTDTLSVSAGTDYTALPSNCMKPLVLYVDHSGSPSGYLKLERINWRDRFRHKLQASSSKESTLYAIRGSNVWWYPVPTWTGNAYLDHVPAFTALSGDSDTYAPGFDGWENWVIGKCCVVLAGVADDSPVVWQFVVDSAERVIDYAVKFDHAGPKTVSDVMSYDWRTDS